MLGTRRGRSWIAGAAALLLVGGALAGCGEKPLETRRLLVVGIDAADWQICAPLLEAGKLPHLASFMEQSARGRMQTFVPLEKSPLLWATITTGVTPDVHGVAHFVSGPDQRPVQGSAWNAPAIWDIAGAADLTTCVVGMWMTYPARPILGVMVSDYLPYGRGRDRPMANLVYPEELTEKVVSLRVAPEEIPDEELARFFPPGALETAKAKWPREVEMLREIWAADRGYVAVNRMLAEGDPVDLFFFYLRGPDMVSHKFYDYLHPEWARPRPDPARVEAFREVLPRYYGWTDEVLGEVLGWFPPDRQTVILSDHGFGGPKPRRAKGTAAHNEWGIFLVRSPLYERGAEFDRIGILDVCPTLLALLGLPPGSDMPGDVLGEALTDEGRRLVERVEKRRTESYMALTPVPGPAGERDEAVDEERRERLRSLGYIN